jgi:hypothetical protein
MRDSMNPLLHPCQEGKERFKQHRALRISIRLCLDLCVCVLLGEVHNGGKALDFLLEEGEGVCLFLPERGEVEGVVFDEGVHEGERFGGFAALEEEAWEGWCVCVCVCLGVGGRGGGGGGGRGGE